MTSMAFIDANIDIYVIFASLKSEPKSKLIKRIPDSRLLIEPRDSKSVLEALPGKLYDDAMIS